MHASEPKTEKTEPRLADVSLLKRDLLKRDPGVPSPQTRGQGGSQMASGLSQDALPPVVQRSLGEILVDRGLLEPRDVKRVMDLQQSRGLRFGDAVTRLGLAKRDDVQHALASQFGYPYARPQQHAFDSSLVAAVDPFSVKAEAFRALRSQLLMCWFTERQNALALVSPDGGEGRSFLAANLAIVFAQLGRRTLLIDADLRGPKQHTLFNLPDKTGLSTILSGRTQKYSAQQVPFLPSLWVVASGPVPPNPLELVSRAEFGQLVEKARQYFDVVLIDTPPSARYSDAEIIALHARAGLLVGCKDRTRVNTMQSLSKRLGRNGVQVLGCVLNAA